jgi:hypothetical protein
MRMQRGLSLGLWSALALGLASTPARAQACNPATTPCQTCPPATCTPTNTPCGSVVPGNITTTTSTLTCNGSFAQTTTAFTLTFGPTQICIGPNQNQGCIVPAGVENIDTATETILFSAVAVPTLSLWGLGALVAGLAAVALRRLAAR